MEPGGSSQSDAGADQRAGVRGISNNNPQPATVPTPSLQAGRRHNGERGGSSSRAKSVRVKIVVSWPAPIMPQEIAARLSATLFVNSCFNCRANQQSKGSTPVAKKLKKQLAGPTKDYVTLEGTHAVLALCMALLKEHAGAITDLELQLSIPTLGETPIAASSTNLSVQGLAVPADC